MVGIVGGLNAEKAMAPRRIVLESDIFDDEIQLPLRLPLLPPRKMRFLERLAECYVLDPIRRWKQADHEIHRLPGLRSLALHDVINRPGQKPQGREASWPAKGCHTCRIAGLIASDDPAAPPAS
jgi:hypothetical protein